MLLDLEGKSYAHPLYRINAAKHHQLSLLKPWQLLTKECVDLSLKNIDQIHYWRPAKLASGPFQIHEIYFASYAGCTGKKPLKQKEQPPSHYAIKHSEAPAGQFPHF